VLDFSWSFLGAPGRAYLLQPDLRHQLAKPWESRPDLVESRIDLEAGHHRKALLMCLLRQADRVIHVAEAKVVAATGPLPTRSATASGLPALLGLIHFSIGCKGSAKSMKTGWRGYWKPWFLGSQSRNGPPLCISSPAPFLAWPIIRVWRFVLPTRHIRAGGSHCQKRRASFALASAALLFRPPPSGVAFFGVLWPDCQSPSGPAEHPESRLLPGSPGPRARS